MLGADQTLALGSARFQSPPTERRPASSFASRGKTHALHSAFAVARDRAIVFEHCEGAQLTMRAFSDDFLDRYLDAAGDAVTRASAPIRSKPRNPIVREQIEGRPFHHSGFAAITAARFLRREGCSVRLIAGCEDFDDLMFVLSLTGLGRNGKGTTARFFAEARLPVHDARRSRASPLRERAVAAAIEAAFPTATPTARSNPLICLFAHDQSAAAFRQTGVCPSADP